DYLFRELSKRRVVWYVTLKDKATADAEREAQVASANLLLPETFGGSEMLLLMGGGTCTQIVFTGMESSSNAVNVGLCIPDGVTNVDIFTCIDLLPHTWTFAARELSIQSTNFLIWTDTNQWPQGEANFRLYSAGDADVDTDEDGYADAREQMVYLTDPLNSNSRPVVVSGTVAYSGSETGTIHVLVTTNESS
ncbi:MAG: hypothetical protein KDL31_14005, partial [Kiritimatiellae bacterium]|nr:hypothetical protein [Kiritimatiellia bacterium]